MKKRLLASLLSLVLITAMAPTAWATEEPGSEEPAETGYYINDALDDTINSLSDAIDRAAGKTVKLTHDEEIAGQITITSTVTIDLNGCILTKGITDGGLRPVFRIESNGVLIIEDTDGNGKIQGGNDEESIITVIGGTLNLKGGTLTGNTSTGDGGAVYVSDGTFNMSGGTISDNTAAEGGGVYATGNSTVTISGGTISDNTATSDTMFNSETSPAGGGGVAIVGGFGYNIKLEMTGGTITGNTAKGAGGGIGIRRGVDTCTPTFTMTGGSITNNTAENAEGGGIRIEGNGEIDPKRGNILITGNKCYSTRDLGGGGIFVVNSGKTTIHNAIITDNTAGGLGGGIAGCIHGEIIDMSTATQGAAIYRNTASGQNYTNYTTTGVADNAENVKTGLAGYDASKVAADLFSAGARANSETDRGAMVVSDRMPGGGSHNWTGVVGGTEVSIAPGSAYHSKDFLVLTANPSEEDIESANEALSDGMVLISDNYARNHGGGIAVNGILEFSSDENQYIMDVEAEVNATKELLQKNTVTGTETPLEGGMAGYTFEIATKRTGGDVICTADSEEDGSVNLVIPADVFDTTKTDYIFYLRERPGDNSSVDYDSTVYPVTIKLTEDESRREIIEIGSSTITKYTYTAVVSITQTTEDGGEVSVEEPTFTNKINYTPGGDSVAISGRKEVSTGAPDTAFRFQLLDSDGAVLDTKELTGGGSFTFDPIAYDPAHDVPGTYTYTVVEKRGSASGWTYDSTRYTVTVEVTPDERGNLSAGDPVIMVNGEPQEEIVFRNSYNPGGGDGGSTTVGVTAEKRWVLDDGGVRPDSVTVELVRNGDPTGRTAVLNAENGWSHRWTNLSDSYNWTVREVNVPDGFTVSYQQRGNTIIITNDDVPDEPEEPDTPDTPDEPDTPDTPDEPDTPDTPDEPDTPDTPDEPDTPDTPSDPGVPQTDDRSLTSLWLGLCMLSLGCLGLLKFTASGRSRRAHR